VAAAAANRSLKPKGARDFRVPFCSVPAFCWAKGGKVLAVQPRDPGAPTRYGALMTDQLAAPSDHTHSFGGDQNFHRGLAGYLAAIAAALGVGMESCTIDPILPATAYLALDWRQRQPGVDLALLWDERCGWAAATEGSTIEDFTILGYLGGATLPAPDVVARFVAAVQHGDSTVLQPKPPTTFPILSRPELTELLADYLLPM
jgi:hypothetical protein